jgi:hypothetical protein
MKANMPRKKKTAKTDGGRINKSAWIRAQPVSLSAKDVVDKASAEGINLSLAQVYTARSTAKRKPGNAQAGAGFATKRGPGRPKKSDATGSASGDLRRQFVQLAVRIGADEAQRLLDRIVDVKSAG